MVYKFSDHTDILFRCFYCESFRYTIKVYPNLALNHKDLGLKMSLPSLWPYPKGLMGIFLQTVARAQGCLPSHLLSCSSHTLRGELQLRRPVSLQTKEVFTEPVGVRTPGCLKMTERGTEQGIGEATLTCCKPGPFAVYF